MSAEAATQSPFLRDPQSIQEFYAEYRTGQVLTPGQMIMIVHMLPSDTRAEFMGVYGRMMAEVWKEHMPGRGQYYDPLIRELTDYRQDVARAISPQPGDVVVDIGSGACSLANDLSKACGGLTYLAMDFSPAVVAPSRALLSTLVSQGRLAGADFYSHDYTSGMPPAMQIPEGAGRVHGVSSYSISYQPADVMVGVVTSAFKAGCDSILVTSLDPIQFNADAILNEMLTNAAGKPGEEQIRLAEVIASAREGAPGREFMRQFEHILKTDMPLRTPVEMRGYLEQAGRIDSEVTFGAGTGGTVGFMVVPISAHS
jgi:hypothetical protein